jgi:hypothetical protein
MLMWCHDHGCPWDQLTFNAAALRGNLEILNFLRDRGCPTSGQACQCAAASGKLAALKFVRGLGCPLDCETAFAAVTSKNFKIFMWVIEQKCSWDRIPLMDLCQAAIQAENLEVLKWAYKQDQNIGHLLHVVARKGNSEILKWFVDEVGVNVPKSVATSLLDETSRDCFRMLAENGKISLKDYPECLTLHGYTKKWYLDNVNKL